MAKTADCSSLAILSIIFSNSIFLQPVFKEQAFPQLENASESRYGNVNKFKPMGWEQIYEHFWNYLPVEHLFALSCLFFLVC